MHSNVTDVKDKLTWLSATCAIWSETLHVHNPSKLKDTNLQIIRATGAFLEAQYIQISVSQQQHL